MSDYILVTNFWNEAGNLRPVIRNVSQQTKKPKEWFFIDDGSPIGSMVSSSTEVTKAGLEARIKTRYFYAPPTKLSGAKHCIGKAWNQYLTELRRVKADYIGILDTDTRLPPSYFEDLVAYLDAYLEVGAVAGAVRGEKRYQHMPMGGGKLVRWEIFAAIDKFWNLAPDTFFNIKSLTFGFKNAVLGLEVSAKPSVSRVGRDLGYRLYYTGSSILVALLKTVRHHDFEIIKGFLESRGANQCTDLDVRYYYSKRRILKSLFKGKGVMR